MPDDWVTLPGGDITDWRTLPSHEDPRKSWWDGVWDKVTTPLAPFTPTMHKAMGEFNQEHPILSVPGSKLAGAVEFGTSPLGIGAMLSGGAEGLGFGGATIANRIGGGAMGVQGGSQISHAIRDPNLTIPQRIGQGLSGAIDLGLGYHGASRELGGRGGANLDHLEWLDQGELPPSSSIGRALPEPQKQLPPSPNPIEELRAQNQSPFGQIPSNIGPSEQTGRVAQFEPKGLRDSLSSDELLQYLNSNELPPELRTEIENLLRSRGVVPNPEDAPPIGGPLYKGWDWNQSEDYSQSPYGPEYGGQEEFPDVTGPGEILSFSNSGIPLNDPRHPLNQPSDIQGLRTPNVLSAPSEVNPSDIYPELDPRMASRAVEGDRLGRAFTPEELQGQMELPWSKGIVDQPIDGDALARHIQNQADMFKAPYTAEPRQMSFEDQMKDDEIQAYLENEDATPPEMIDLSQYGPNQELFQPDWKSSTTQDKIEQVIEDYKDKNVQGGFKKPGDPNKVVIPEIGFTEQDADDLRSIRYNKSRVAKMPQGGDFSKEFLDIFPDLKGQFSHITGWGRGAVSVELKNGRGMSIDRDALTGVKIPEGNDYDTSNGGKLYTQTVMNPERFDRQGNFVGDAGMPPESLARYKEHNAKVAEAQKIAKERKEVYLNLKETLGREPSSTEMNTALDQIKKMQEELSKVWESIGGKSGQQELPGSKGRNESKGGEPEFKLTPPPRWTPEEIKGEQGELKFPDPNQGKLKLRPATGIRKADLQAMFEGLDPLQEDHRIDRQFATDELEGLGPGDPGLEFSSYEIGPGRISHQLVYRDSNGKPIGTAYVVKRPFGPPKVETLAIDKDAGLGQGPALLAMVRKLVELKAVVPKGAYSPYTSNLVRSLSAFLDDQEPGKDQIMDRNNRRIERQQEIKRQKRRREQDTRP